MAVFLGNENAESWNHSLMAFSPLPWMYKCSYLKYLFIVIPGSIAGEYLHEWLHCKNTMPVNDNKRRTQKNAMDTLIDHRTDRIQFIRTLYALSYSQFSGYNRYIMRSLHSLASGRKNTGYWYKLFRAGTYLILLGLAFEAYEGGTGKILLRTVITSLHRDLPLWR